MMGSWGCFESRDGEQGDADPCGGEQRAARYVNSIRQGIAQLMAPPNDYGETNAAHRRLAR